MKNFLKGLVFDGLARIFIIDTSSILRNISDIQSLSNFSIQALGRALSIGAYVSFNIKSNTGRFNLILDGTAEISKIYVAGEGQGYIKAYVDVNNSKNCLNRNPLNKVFLSRDGFFSLIKDVGLKEPYIGRTEIISGNISDDFAYYLLKSEGIKSAVGLNVIIKNNEYYSYGIICEAMPGASDEALYILEDIMSQFNDITNFMLNNDLISTFNFYFGHLQAEILSVESVSFYCDCIDRSDNIIKCIGDKEIENILAERKEVEIKCDYCNKIIVYDKAKLEKLFGRKF